MTNLLIKSMTNCFVSPVSDLWQHKDTKLLFTVNKEVHLP